MYYFVYYVKICIDEIPLDNDDRKNVINYTVFALLHKEKTVILHDFHVQ